MNSKGCLKAPIRGTLINSNDKEEIKEAIEINSKLKNKINYFESKAKRKQKP